MITTLYDMITCTMNHSWWHHYIIWHTHIYESFMMTPLHDMIKCHSYASLQMSELLQMSQSFHYKCHSHYKRHSYASLMITLLHSYRLSSNESFTIVFLHYHHITYDMNHVQSCHYIVYESYHYIIYESWCTIITYDM